MWLLLLLLMMATVGLDESAGVAGVAGAVV
jgi:hypothetical protein